MEFFQDYKTLFIIGHIVGTALGVGGATITDTLFFKFLKDFKISGWEANVMKTLSSVIWIGLGVIFLSGLGLFLSNPAGYLASSKFITKMFVVAIITINGLVLHRYITPHLKRITFHEKHDHKKGELHKLRKLAFASGAVSISSWYIAMTLGVLRSIPYTIAQGIAGAG